MKDYFSKRKKESEDSTRRLFWSSIKKTRNGRIPILFKLNIWFFNLTMPDRCYFFMQQIVFGYAEKLAMQRSIEWSSEQIVEWQKARQ